MSETMSKKDLDRLSAVIDGEAEEIVMLQVSHDISRNRELRETLLRYQLIGDCLRGEEANPHASNLVMAVSRRLESEPTVLAPVDRPQRSRWLQPVAGAAIAASVAAVGVMLGPQFINAQKGGGSGPTEGIQVVANPKGPVAVAPVLVSQEEMQWKSVENRNSPKLIRYLESHNHYATQNGLPGVIPYTTLVSYGGASSRLR